MKVSILTVVYNNVATIASAINSILEQTYKNKEFIVIDGGSNDGTLEKINEYKEAIDVLVSESDAGIYDAMNKGLRLATGDVICILNSDDIYANPFVIERIVRQFEDQGCDGVYGDLQYVSSDDIKKVVRNWKSGLYHDGSFLFGWMPPHPSFFVKRSVYEKYGDFNTLLKSAADYELMLRFIHKHKIRISYLPEVLVKMRTGGVSNSSLKNRLRANMEDRRAWELNELKPYFFTLFLKPLRKLTQFF